MSDPLTAGELLAILAVLLARLGKDATGAPVALAGPDAINPPPDPSAAVTGPHNTERTTP